MLKKILTLAVATFLCQHTCLGQIQASASDKGAESYTLADFYRNNDMLDQQVALIFGTLSDEQRVGQLIVPAAGRLGKPDAVLDELVRNGRVGGIILLNGTVDQFKKYVHHFDSISKANGHLPLVYCADAEPSLINRKISGSTQVPKTAALKDTLEARAVAHSIARQLKEIGIFYNYAPVTDLSLQNTAIGNRSFGSDPNHVAQMNKAFILASQSDGVATTAKHFPGHGLVKGDSHSQLVFIDGPMQEVDLYKGLIDSGVLSIMTGHIAVKNNPKYNTDGQPASLSPTIVTKLLKEEMGFRGIVTTDAMNMGAVAAIPNAPLKAVQAGNDMILMPENEKESITSILEQMKKDPAFEQQVYDSVKKIIRFKLVLGVIR